VPAGPEYDNTSVILYLHLNHMNSPCFRISRNVMEKKWRSLCFGEYIRFGEILSSILPAEYRNNDLAELCYLKCLDMMPRNSKANHRMGLLQLLGVSSNSTVVLGVRLLEFLSNLPNNVRTRAFHLEISRSRCILSDIEISISIGTISRKPIAFSKICLGCPPDSFPIPLIN
jgi:hypothetical protein